MDDANQNEKVSAEQVGTALISTEPTPAEIEEAVESALDARVSGGMKGTWQRIMSKMRADHPQWGTEHIAKVVAIARTELATLYEETQEEERNLMRARLEEIYSSSSSKRWQLKALDQMAQVLGLRKGDIKPGKKKFVFNIQALSDRDLAMLEHLQKKLRGGDDQVKLAVNLPPMALDSSYPLKPSKIPVVKGNFGGDSGDEDEFDNEDFALDEGIEGDDPEDGEDDDQPDDQD